MSLNFEQYQFETSKTATYPGVLTGSIEAVVYTTLGLAGEAGEIPNKVKKILRDEGGVLSEEKRQAILAEIGDVLWYAARLADELDASLGGIAQANLDKLTSRQERGVIGGSGDDR